MGQYCCGACCGPAGAAVGKITDDAAKEVAKFMGKVTVTYVKGLLILKVEDCIDEIVNTADITEIEEEDDDEKKEIPLEEREENPEIPIIVSGVYLTGYKNATGPDTLKHVYYDFSTFCIRPEGSVISRVTYKHSQLKKINEKFQKKIENIPEETINTFPTEKKPKKELAKFHKTRYEGIDKYCNAISLNPLISTNDYFLVKFKLKYDANAAERQQLFIQCLQDVCQDEEIDFDEAFEKASELGIELEEVEMLKFVAVKKIFGNFSEKLQESIKNKMPKRASLNVVNATIQKCNDTLVKILASVVETGWKNAISKTFKVLHETVSKVLEKVKETLKKIIKKIVDPIKKILSEKLKKLDEKTSISDENNDLENVKLSKFSNINDALNNLKDEECKKSCEDICNDVITSVDELNKTHIYINYIRYNMKFKKIVEYFESIKDINEKHTRTSIAMLDTICVLAKSLGKAMLPLCKYVDKASKEYDKEKHKELVRECILEGGKQLAMDYFNLPHSIWKSTKDCSQDVSNKILEFARVTVSKMADLLGTIANEWEPEDKTDVRKSFAKIIELKLQPFLGKRLMNMASIIRSTTVDLISDLVDKLFGKTIYKVTETVDNLLKKLPDPLCKLNTTKLIKFVLKKVVAITVGFAVKMWARNTEKWYTKESNDLDTTQLKIPEFDQDLCKSWRTPPSLPKIKFEPLELDFDEDKPQV